MLIIFRNSFRFNLIFIATAVLFFVFTLFVVVRHVLAISPPVVETTISIVADGSSPLDGTTFDPVGLTNPGTDASATNGIIRNGDSVTYRVETNLNGTDSDNLTFTLTLSAEQEIAALPSLCLTSRSLAGLSPISSISSNKRVLVCNTGVIKEGTTATVDVIARVKATTPNNTSISASVSSTADGANTDTSGPVSVIATGRPIYDVAQSFLSATSGSADVGSGLEPGYIATWVMSMRYVRGSESLQNGTVTLTASVTNGGPNNNPLLIDCSQLTAITGAPYSEVGVVGLATNVNSAVDSGSIICSQPGGPGTDINLTVTNPVLSPDSFPIKFSNNNNIPANDSYVISFVYRTFHPQSDVPAPTSTITYTNTISPTSTPLSLSGQVATESSTANNSGVYSVVGTNPVTPGTGIMNEQIFVSTPLENDKDYPTDDFTADVINTTQRFVPGSEVPFSIKSTHTHNNGFVLSGLHTQTATEIVCVKPDNNFEFTGQFRTGLSENNYQSKSEMMAKFFRGELTGNILPTAYPGGGLNLAAGAHINNPDAGFTLANYAYFSIRNSALEDQVYLAPVTIEYSFNAPGNVHTSTCNDGDATWISSFGSTPELVRQIRYKITWEGQSLGSEIIRNVFNANPIFQLKAGTPVGDLAGVWVSTFTHSPDSGYFNPYGWWHSDGEDNPLDSDYAFDPIITSGSGVAARVQAVDSIVRVRKNILNEDVLGNPRVNYSAGDTINYRLTSELTLPTSPPGGTTTVTLTDILPAGLSYNYDASVTQGGPCVLVTALNTPSAGQTTLTWTCSSVALNGLTTSAPIIEFSATVNPDIMSGTYTNSVTVASPIDTLSLDIERTDKVQITINTPGTFNVSAESLTPGIEVGDDIAFSLYYGNTGSIALTETKLINILPFNTNPLDPTSDFNGTAVFKNITGVQGEAFEFTKANPTTIQSDPCHVSNVPLGETASTYSICANLDSLVGGAVGTGSTQWCSLSAPFNNGTFAGLPSGCPHSLSEVTGIQISGGSFAIGQPRRELVLTMSTAGNELADIYSLEVSGRAANYELFVISNDPFAEVVSGSISGTVWLDNDSNGTQNGGETGIGGVTVSLIYAGADNTFGTLDDTTVTDITDGSGDYGFTGLPIGIYQTVVDTNTLPSALTQTYDLDGLGTPHLIEVTLVQILNGLGVLTGVTEITNADFGYVYPASGSSGSNPNSNPETGTPEVPSLDSPTPTTPITPTSPGGKLPVTGISPLAFIWLIIPLSLLFILSLSFVFQNKKKTL